MSWQYTQPVDVIFGNGKFSDIYQLLPGSKGILITSKSFMRNGIAEKLQTYAKGKIMHIFCDVTPNPDIKECKTCIAQIKEQKFDFIVALGGGSVIDFAKIISVMSATGKDVEDWYANKADIPTCSIPLIAIPTTAGTGSELTCVAVISDHQTNMKRPLVAKSFYPVTALIDPELTYTVPQHLTACAGFDVLCHAIEAYWSKHHQPICDALAIYALKLVLKYLKRAWINGKDSIAREKMAEASVIAGMAFTLPKTTAPHACSYPLTNHLGIAHGEACALTIDYFIKINYEHGCDRVLELSKELGFHDVEEFARRIKQLKQDLQLLDDLKKFTVTDKLLKELIKGSQNPNMLNNPVGMSREHLGCMYKSML